MDVRSESATPVWKTKRVATSIEITTHKNVHHWSMMDWEFTFWVNFYNVLLRIPAYQSENVHTHEHVQAFRCSTGLFDDFETEPRSNSSKKNEDVYLKCSSFYLT